MDEGRGERFYGPYRHRRQFRIVAVGASGERETFTFPTADDAVRWKAKREAEAQGRTVTEAIAAYRTSLEERGLRKGTVATACYRLAGLLGQRELLLAVLTPGRARELVAGRKPNVATETLRNEAATASLFARWCVSKRWLRADPFEGIAIEGPRASGKPKLRIDEARKLMGAALAEGTHAGLAVALALATGARASELTDRVVRDVDDGCSVLWIECAKTDAGNRRLDIPEELRDRMSALVADRGQAERLFGDVDRHWLYYHVRRLCKAAGVPVVSPHGLRGTIAELETEARGAAAARDLLGHEHEAITVRSYAGRAAADVQKQRAAWRVLQGGRK